jgi:type II secretory pathway component PulC
LLSGPNQLRHALSAICLIILVVIAVELVPSRPDLSSTTRVLAPLQPDVANAPSFTLPPAVAFTEILARPLFSRTRRPSAQAGQLPASSSLTLVAVVISTDERHALLGSGQPSKVARVHEGDTIAGWTVEAIMPDKVIVRRVDAREEIKPGRGNTTKPPIVSTSRRIPP